MPYDPSDREKYAHDIETGRRPTISKFADDTKVGGRALTRKECEAIQNDLDKIIQWSEQWQMPFNLEKCKVMPFGTRNSNYTYKMRGEPLRVVNEE